jgi:hypothetical protein
VEFMLRDMGMAGLWQGGRGISLRSLGILTTRGQMPLDVR